MIHLYLPMKYGYLPLILVCSFVFASCSTQKNTWRSRSYHELTTRYNIHYNGNEAYKQGIKRLNEGFKEDYSERLPVFKVSRHSLAKSTSGSMNQAIEKCEKAIKQHSIRVKPEKKPTRSSSERYKQFYAQEEFNPFMDKVFLLMARAQFHQADFMAASATCQYILRHFPEQSDISIRARLLLARCYVELEWMFDAEREFDLLNNLQLPSRFTGDYAAAWADFLIRRGRISEAISPLKMALANSGTKQDKHRWRFLLAQLLQETGQLEEAGRIYGSIPRKNPPYHLEINARIRETEVVGSDPKRQLKQLKRWSKSSKNTDYLDQIYYAMGNLYWQQMDTVEARKHYHLALDKSTHGPIKTKIVLALAEFYIQQEDFRSAAPLYAQAASLVGKEDKRYPSVIQMNEPLKLLYPHLETIHLQDSLLDLSEWPRETLEAYINERVEEAEKAAKEADRDARAAAANQANENLQAARQSQQPTPSTPVVPNEDRSWYFYNETAKTNGLAEFKRVWGNRQLADNWRSQATANPMGEMAAPALGDTLINPEVLSTDSTRTQDFTEQSDDPTHPNYYWINIPFSPEKKQSALDKIEESLMESAMIFREHMENDRQAERFFARLESDYPASAKLEMAWYIQYLMFKQKGELPRAEANRSKLLQRFPDSPYAQRLTDSLFLDKLYAMYQQQDSVYEASFEAFQAQAFDSLFESMNTLAPAYRLSPMLDRFLFLEAMAYGHTGQAEAFHANLLEIKNEHSQSPLMPTVEAMLALWDEGQRPMPGLGYQSLLGQNSDTVLAISGQEELIKKLSFEPQQQHLVLMYHSSDSIRANRLQFDVALYNFTAYLIRDYELTQAMIGSKEALMIQMFDNLEDALRYTRTVNFANQRPEAKYPGLQMVVVSEDNLKRLQEGLELDQYLDFLNKQTTQP
ncbi:MAG TPA: hypothetical protein VJ871_03145 [Bacteroidales bacterium]|nr:hypothetical protein [Bacteroidales bacterium]